MQKKSSNELNEDHLQNHYFEYGTVNKIDEVLYAMEIIFTES